MRILSIAMLCAVGCGEPAAEGAFTADDAEWLAAFVKDSISDVLTSDKGEVELGELWSKTVACPSGGSLKYSLQVGGDVDVRTGNGTIAGQMTILLTDCAVAPQGRSMVLNGDPNIAATITATIVSWDPTAIMFDVGGAFRWRLSSGEQGRAGVSINLKYVPGSGWCFSGSGTIGGFTVRSSCAGLPDGGVS